MGLMLSLATPDRPAGPMEAMVAQADRMRERLWIVLSTDGRHGSVGRYTDPSEEEIADLEKGLVTQGLAGWLAVSEGDYHAKRGRMNLMMVRPLGNPETPFEDAVEAYETIRRAR